MNIRFIGLVCIGFSIAGCGIEVKKECDQWAIDAEHVMQYRQQGLAPTNTLFEKFDKELVEQAYLVPLMETEQLRLMAISKFKLNRLTVCENS